MHSYREQDEFARAASLEQPKWDNRFMELAEMISTWSKDPSTKIGVIIVKDRKIKGTGYNGFPKGIDDFTKRLYDRDVKYAYTIHAEINAILDAGTDAKDSTMYLYGMPGPPCKECSKLIIQAGITEVVTRSGEEPERWKESFDFARGLLEEARVNVRYIP